VGAQEKLGEGKEKMKRRKEQPKEERDQDRDCTGYAKTWQAPLVVLEECEVFHGVTPHVR
jgi:hypothetical protein